MKIHFIGIGGIGISGLAQYMHFKGHTVSGSDIKDTIITKKLRSLGIEINVPHLREAIIDQDLVVHSAIIGAESKEFGSNVRYDKDTDLMIFEADESDGSFINSNPYCAIVINAEPEHMEYYDYNYELFYQTYRTFIESAKHRVLNAEDPFLAQLSDIEATRLYPSLDIKNIEYVLIDDEPHTKFELKNMGAFCVWGFGEHIAVDASLAVLAALEEMELEDIRTNLLNFKGIKKRFDIINIEEESILIDDYGHHPTEIKATMQSVREYARLKGFDKITAIWQPHKYSRTLDNLEAFISCFDGCDELIILPVWAAGEAARHIDFKEKFARYNLTMADSIKRDEGKLDLVKENHIIKTLDHGIIVGFGAGDITYQLRGLV